jgi:CHAT domain-containing protein/LysM repeat protein
MMRRLLILISCIALQLKAVEYYEYEVRSGDTLSEIAFELDISLKEIYEANSSIGFNPNDIRVGQKILIPDYDSSIKWCPSGVTIFSTFVYPETEEGRYLEGLPYYEGIDELVNYCYDEAKKIELRQLPIQESLRLVKSDITYQFSLVPDLDSADASVAEKASQIFCTAAIEGVKRYLAGEIFEWCIFSEERILNSDYDENIKQTLLYYYGFLEFSQAKKINFYLLPKQIRISFLNMLLAEAVSNSDKDLKWLINESYSNMRLFLISSPAFFSHLFEVTNLMFYMINYSDPRMAGSLYYQLLQYACNFGCTVNYENIVLDNSYDSYWWGSFNYSISNIAQLNGTNGLLYDVGTNDDEVYVIREAQIENFERKLSNFKGYPSLISSTKENLGILYSDLATHAAGRGRCSYAGEMIEKAFRMYEEKQELTNLFREPIEVGSCFLRVKDISSATKYFNLALQSSDLIKEGSPLEIVEKIVLGVVHDESSEFILEAYENIINIESVTSTERKSFEVAIELLFISELIYETNSLDYIKVKNKLRELYSSESLINSKASKTNNSIKDLQDTLEQISKSITKIENNLELVDENKKNELISLYEQKKDIIRSLFSNSEELKNLYANSYNNQNELIREIPLTANVLTYFIFDGSGWAVIFNSDGVNLRNVGTNAGQLIGDITKLEKSLSSNENFGFETANNLYKTIFSPFEDLISQGTEIYIYDSTEVNIPLSILVRKIPETKNYEEALIKADWLIRDYSFAYLYPFNKKRENKKFKEKFLGLANSTSYTWADLPPLSSSEDEIQNLALSSNAKKENILLGQNATKEKLLEKLDKNYERIVIATHAVPKGWRGYVNEAALIMASNERNFFLTASEISQNKFDSEMVILSSCSGINNDFRDLYKSFLVAGAESVIHANWQLESKFATDFTDELFKELWINDNLKKHVAIRNVALNYLNDYSNPLYSDPSFWGNFSIGYSNL